MTSSARIFGYGLLRIPRKALVAVMLAAYIVAGAMHGLCGFDVTTPSGTAIFSFAQTGIDHSDKGTVADQHCHGCFSVSIPAPIVVAVSTEIVTRHAVLHEAVRRGLPRGIDPPPPKFLI